MCGLPMSGLWLLKQLLLHTPQGILAEHPAKHSIMLELSLLAVCRCTGPHMVVVQWGGTGCLAALFLSSSSIGECLRL